jgi:hypothetical protein
MLIFIHIAPEWNAKIVKLLLSGSTSTARYSCVYHQDGVLICNKNSNNVRLKGDHSVSG